MFEIPFVYIVLTAFKLLLQYDERNSVALKDLENYTKFIVDALKELSQESDDFDGKIKDIDFYNDLKELVQKYPNIFWIKNDNLILNSQVGFDEVSILASRYQIFPEEMDILINSKECWESLNMKKIKEMVEILNNNESCIEKNYENLSQDDYDDTKMKQLLNLRNILNLKMIFNGITNVEKIWKYLTLVKLTEEEVEETDSIFNENFYKNSIYAKLFRNEGADVLDIEVMMNNLFQKAIFSNESLYPSKINYTILSLMYFESKEDRDKYAELEELTEEDQEELDEFVQEEIFAMLGLTDENIDSVEIMYEKTGEDLQIPLEYVKRKMNNEGEEQFVFSFPLEENDRFYIMYLKKIDDYEEKNGVSQVLSKIKKRLLYVLDNINYKLYNKDQRNNIYKSLDEISLDDLYLTRFKLEAEYFIEEIFSVPTVKILEKLLFISTYYELTKDKDIETLLSKYSDNENYENYKKIIIGNKNNKIYKKYKN